MKYATSALANPSKLVDELQAAGLKVRAVVSRPQDRRSPETPILEHIEFAHALTEIQTEQVEKALAAHDPTPSRQQQLDRLGFDERTAALILVVTRGADAPAWARDVVERAASKLFSLE